jgi:hypothetical protein
MEKGLQEVLDAVVRGRENGGNGEFPEMSRRYKPFSQILAESPKFSQFLAKD